jgi:hypothetical protein
MFKSQSKIITIEDEGLLDNSVKTEDGSQKNEAV